MTKHFKVIPPGTFKGKRITIAETGRVDEHQGIAGEFILDIFGLQPGDYAISDESELRDFVAFGNRDTSHEWERIEELYGIGKLEAGTERLVDIFTVIARRRSTQ